MDHEMEVVVDDRGRVSLGPLVEKNRIYVGRRFADGSVVLEPAVMPSFGPIPGVVEPRL